MRSWALQHAKARFCEFVDHCVNDGPQLVTRRGTAAAVLVAIDEWERLRAAARPSLKQLLLSESDRVDLELPQRGAGRHRHAALLDADRAGPTIATAPIAG